MREIGEEYSEESSARAAEEIVVVERRRGEADAASEEEKVEEGDRPSFERSPSATRPSRAARGEHRLEETEGDRGRTRPPERFRGHPCQGEERGLVEERLGGGRGGSDPGRGQSEVGGATSGDRETIFRLWTGKVAERGEFGAAGRAVERPWRVAGRPFGHRLASERVRGVGGAEELEGETLAAARRLAGRRSGVSGAGAEAR